VALLLFQGLCQAVSQLFTCPPPELSGCSSSYSGALDVFINCIPFRLVMTATVKLMAQRTRTQLSKDEARQKRT